MWTAPGRLLTAWRSRHPHTTRPQGTAQQEGPTPTSAVRAHGPLQGSAWRRSSRRPPLANWHRRVLGPRQAPPHGRSIAPRVVTWSVVGPQGSSPSSGTHQSTHAPLDAALGDGHASQAHQARRRLVTGTVAVPVGLGDARGRGASRTAQVLLLPAATAFAIPSAVWAAEALPAVESESASPGLGHRRLLGHEPYRLDEGNCRSDAAVQ